MLDAWLAERVKTALILLFIIALLLRFIVALTYQGGIDRELIGDEPLFQRYAQSILDGRGYTADGEMAARAPLFSLFVAAIYAVSGRSMLALQLGLALLGSFSCLLIYLVARRYFSVTVSLLAMAIAAAYPLLIDYGRRLLSENLFIFLLLLQVWLLLRFSDKPTLRGAVLAGLALGLAILTRAALLAFVPLIPVWLFLAGRPERVRSAVQGLLIVFVALIVIFPWTLRNYVVFNRWIPISSDGGITLLGCNNEFVWNDPLVRGGWAYTRNFEPELQGLNEVERDSRASAIAWSFITSHWTIMPEFSLWKLFRWLNPFPAAGTITSFIYFLPSTLVILSAFVGVALTATSSIRPLLFYFLLAYFALLTTVFCGENRLRLPVEPFLVIFAAFALVRAGLRVGAIR